MAFGGVGKNLYEASTWGSPLRGPFCFILGVNQRPVEDPTYPRKLQTWRFERGTPQTWSYGPVFLAFCWFWHVVIFACLAFPEFQPLPVGSVLIVIICS